MVIKIQPYKSPKGNLIVITYRNKACTLRVVEISLDFIKIA